MQGVENKVVLITGASSGIGEVTAKLLAANGARVVLSARREARLQKLTSEIGPNAVYLRSDVTDADDMKALAARAKEAFGRIDVLFANAGIMPGSNMSERKVADWMRMVDITIKGVLNAMAAVLPEFTARKSGHIIVTASVALLLMNFSRSGRTVDESRAGIKRIVITWAILNSLGFILSYVVPFFEGGQWTDV